MLKSFNPKVSVYNFVSALTFCALVTLSLLASSAQAQINHLELGAGNYRAVAGADLDKRYEILVRMTNDLVAQYGDTGVIYLNDINISGLDAAKNYLTQWLIQNNKPNIQVVALPGDYSVILLPQVRSAHLGNPGVDQIPSWNNSLNPKLNKIVMKGLEYVASHSETGLSITTYLLKGPTSMKSLNTYVGLGWKLEDTGRDGHPYNTMYGTDADVYFQNSSYRETKVFTLKKETFCRTVLPYLNKKFRGL